MFQHTAARRRLLYFFPTNSRTFCFNTQPRGGGCKDILKEEVTGQVSTHSRAEAAAFLLDYLRKLNFQFQHTAARRRLRY